jgi:hypothetical protein
MSLMKDMVEAMMGCDIKILATLIVVHRLRFPRRRRTWYGRDSFIRDGQMANQQSRIRSLAPYLCIA